MPGYTEIDKPTQGDATRKPLADALIDNDAFFNSVLSALNWLQVPNGSFEIDSDADGEPDLWEVTLYTGGSFALTGNLLADTDCRHGARAIKFTSPGGAGNGGGYVEGTEYTECSPDRRVIVSWLHKSSVATIRNKVDVLFYDANRTFLSTVNIFSSITNPTSWTLLSGAAVAPSTARFCRLRFTGAENTTTVAGSAYFDGVQLLAPNRPAVEVFTANGTWIPKAPHARIRCWGGGGAGGASGSGAGGGYGEEIVDVIPGASYSVTIGAGGTAAGAGGTTSVGSLISATGGAGNGGAGGTSSATFNVNGQDGGSANDWGGSTGGGGGGGGAGSTNPTAGEEPGGGGGSSTSGADQNGAKGRVIIEYLY